ARRPTAGDSGATPYRAGSSGVGTYVRAAESLFTVEYECVCHIFAWRDNDGAGTLSAACAPAVADMARSLRELAAQARARPRDDCCLAYEVVGVVSSLSAALETRTGGVPGLRASLAAAVRPARDAAKTSLAELLDDTRRR